MKIKEVQGVVSYELSFSKGEAEIILNLCRNVGGDPGTTTARPLINSIVERLVQLKVPTDQHYFNGRLTAIR